MSTYRISQLVARTGVPATTLRFYEDEGLLPAGRTAGGYRVWGEDAVDRLAFISAAKSLGLPLEEISDLLGVWASGPCAQVKADLRPRLAARLAQARARVTELDAFTGTLQGALSHLDVLPDRATRCVPDCLFLASPAAPARDVPETLTEPSPALTPELTPAPAPVACSLDGEGFQARAERWRELLTDAERVEIPGGLRLSLPAARAGAVAELAVEEQRCCPFFGFRLDLDGPLVRLEVVAPAEGAGMLTDLFA